MERRFKSRRRRSAPARDVNDIMNGEIENINSGGREAARQVREKFATRDVFSIAETIGLKIVYESWFPVTVGEFDKKRRTIFVNERAEESDEKIIAHELGHYFAQNFEMNKAEEERFAHDFAEHFVRKEED